MVKVFAQKATKFGTKIQHYHADMPRDQNRNRKIIRMTSSVERWEQMSVVISDYTRHMSQIYYTAQKYVNRDMRIGAADYRQQLRDGFQSTCSRQH